MYPKERVRFDKLFLFAEKHYGIGWNEANSLFFEDLLTYRSFDDLYLSDLAAMIQTEVEDSKSFFEELIVDIGMDEGLAYAIAGKFLLSLGLTEVMVDCK